MARRGGPPAGPPHCDACTLAAGLVPATVALTLGVVAGIGPGDRLPSVLARDLTALDVVSGGRSAVLLDAGPEAAGPEGPGPATCRRLAEAAAVCRALFTEGPTEFDGAFYLLTGAMNRPGPVRPGGPAVLVGLPAGHAAGLADVGSPADWWAVVGGTDQLDAAREARAARAARDGAARRPGGGADHETAGGTDPGGLIWRGDLDPVGDAAGAATVVGAVRQAGAAGVIVRLAPRGRVPGAGAVAAAAELLGPLVGPPVT